MGGGDQSEPYVVALLQIGKKPRLLVAERANNGHQEFILQIYIFANM